MFKFIQKNDSARIIQYSDDILGLEITSKMGILDANIFNMMINASELTQEKNAKLIISSNAKIISAGADLKFFMQNIANKNFDTISERIKLGQKAMLSIKHCSMPVIVATHGIALGGGAEILLHSQHSNSSPEP